MIPDKNIFLTLLLKWIFYGLILLLFWPIISLTCLLTHDGPAHIYNACLIRELISGNPLVSDFLQLKKIPEPNCTGHFILSALSLFFSPLISEKIFLGAYIISFPLLFRRTIRIVNVNSETIALLGLPFVYSYFFTGGLYNFLTGMTLLFASLNIILPQFEKPGNKKYQWIFVFSLLLYFSHLVAFGVFLLMIFLAHLFNFKNEKNNGNKKGFVFFIRSSMPLLLSLLLSLILLTFFFIDKFSIPANTSSVSFSEMMEALIYISPIITLQYSPENIYSVIILTLLIVLLFAGMILWYSKNKGQKISSTPFYKRPVYWAIASLTMLLFFFLIPDQAASGGVIKFRFELFFYLFLIVFISTLPVNRLINSGIIFTITIWMVLKIIYLYPLMKSLDDDTKTVMRCTDHINENSILLPLTYSPNWMHCNILNYIGTVKNILVLDNYEAGMPHFPLEWKKGRNPVAIMGNFNIEPPPLCADIYNFEKQTGHMIDYIVVWKYQPLTDKCTIAIQSVLSASYHLVYSEDESLKLYKRN